MKKLAFLLLTVLPFIGFSQYETHGFSYVKNPYTAITPTSSKVSVQKENEQINSYSEDDYKLLFDGSDQTFYRYQPTADAAKIHHTSIHEESYPLPIYSEDDFKMFYDVTVQSSDGKANKTVTTKKSATMHQAPTNGTYPDAYKYNAPDVKENIDAKDHYTRLIRVYENPKVYYEIEVDEFYKKKRN